MLQGCGVIHHLRAAVLEDAVQSSHVTDIRQNHILGVQKPVAHGRQLGVLQGGLIPVHHDQLRRGVLHDLTAQLRADRPAGASDEHPLPRKVLGRRVHLSVHRLAADQVLDGQVPQVLQTHGGRQLAVQHRQHPHMEAQRGGGVRHRADEAVVGGRDGHDQLGGTRAIHRLRQVLKGPHHGDTPHHTPPQAGVVVQEPDGPVLGLRVDLHPARKNLAQHACPVDEGGGGVLAGANPRLPPQAMDVAQPQHEDQRNGPRDEQ